MRKNTQIVYIWLWDKLLTFAMTGNKEQKGMSKTN